MNMHSSIKIIAYQDTLHPVHAADGWEEGGCIKLGGDDFTASHAYLYISHSTMYVHEN